jgi:multiple sugar transport system ATP-binding protein
MHVVGRFGAGSRMDRDNLGSVIGEGEIRMSRVIFDQVTKIYGAGEQPAVNNLSFEIEDEEFLVVVGPSGCGKSTAMRMVAGLEEISSGRIIIGDRVVNDLPPKDRNVAMVFQSYALYPHMSVRDNLAYPLKLRKVPKAEREQRVTEAARILDIEQYLDRKPKALSGGQRQRVALGRAIVRNADVFLMDEPLSNLDAKLRVQTRAELVKLHDRVRTTTIYVTHDQTEAMTMGDRIAVMSLGVLQQLDTPQNLYDNPANKFVAGFMGSPAMNFLDVTLEAIDGRLFAVTPGFRMQVPDIQTRNLQGHIGKTVTMGIRPEHISLPERLGGKVADASRIPVTVDVVELLGNEIFVYLTNRGATLTARMDPDIRLERGQEIEVAAEPDKMHFFDAQTEQTLR